MTPLSVRQFRALLRQSGERGFTIRGALIDSRTVRRIRKAQ